MQQTQWTLQQLMTDNKVSLRRLSRQIGVSPSLLSRMCSLKRHFLYHHKLNISKVFNCEVEHIQWPDQ